ncbi:MAG: AAA family ATPase [Candidatus Omnitrophica bacterium]|nr:AAA family ATPase [Candidatus Omnitrophota bacterium]
MRIIAIANQKGGCGKTTTSINFSACLAHLQKKVLLVDLDPQGHSTCGLGIQTEKLEYTLYDLLSRDRVTSGPVVSGILCKINPNFWLLPSDNKLNDLEEELLKQPQRWLKEQLARFICQMHDFDFVVLDCPPNLGMLTFNGLEAADEVMIPIEPSFFSLHGLAKISETIHEVNRRRKIPLEVHALMTLFDSRTCFAREVYDEVKTHFRDRLFRTIIHESVILKEAASAGQSVVQYDSNSSAFRDYFNLTVEYLKREWEHSLPPYTLGWENLMANRFGPRRAVGGILFQFLGKNARTVEVAGDFNRWIPESLIRRGPEGVWQKVIPVVRGEYRYQFVVDGQWQIDPYHPVQRENAFGTFDSYLELS